MHIDSWFVSCVCNKTRKTTDQLFPIWNRLILFLRSFFFSFFFYSICFLCMCLLLLKHSNLYHIQDHFHWCAPLPLSGHWLCFHLWRGAIQTAPKTDLCRFHQTAQTNTPAKDQGEVGFLTSFYVKLLLSYRFTVNSAVLPFCCQTAGKVGRHCWYWDSSISRACSP